MQSTVILIVDTMLC